MRDKVLKCVLIDDSNTQRILIGKLIVDHPNLILKAVYKNCITAQNGIRKLDLDLIFLDIEMPIVNGFDFLESLEKKPEVVLISGKAKYALKAFDYDITDYLQKPIAKPRFNAAVQRVLANKIRMNFLQKKDNYIYVNSNLQRKKIIINQIKWIEAVGDYVKLVTESGNLLVLSTMKAFLDRLPKNRFIRIHKSFIVNVGRIDKFCGTSVEIEQRQIPLSRSKRDELEKALT